MTDKPRSGRTVTGDAAPQNKATAPGETRGAQPTTTQSKPANPPSGPSGVSPSENGSR